MALHLVHEDRDAPLVVTFSEAARLLGGRGLDDTPKPVSVRHIERLVAAGRLKAVGRGKARRVLHRSVIAYLDQEVGNG